MDTKQFNAFQTAIQWVKDEYVEPSGLAHEQEVWSRGVVQSETVTVDREASGLSMVFNVMCPTACCVAGNIVVAHGDTLIVHHGYVVGGEVTTDYCLTDDNKVRTIPSRACEVAGLVDDEAEVLFNEGNDAEHIISMAYDIASDHGYDLDLK